MTNFHLMGICHAHPIIPTAYRTVWGGGFFAYPKPYHCSVSSGTGSGVFKIFLPIFATSQTAWYQSDYW
jgi:hypothetical protein